MKKTCEHIEPDLSAYIFDELDPPARTEVEQHLAACENCRKELTELRATLGALEEKFHATPVAAELSPKRLEAIRAGATSESLTEKRSANVVSIGVKRHPILWTLGMAAAAMLLVVPVVYESMQPKPIATSLLVRTPTDAEVDAMTARAIEKQEEMRARIGSMALGSARAGGGNSTASAAPALEAGTRIAIDDANVPAADSSYRVNATSTDPISETGYPGHALSEVGEAITELEAGNREPSRWRAKAAKAKVERQIASLPASAAPEPESYQSLKDQGYLGGSSIKSFSQLSYLDSSTPAPQDAASGMQHTEVFYNPGTVEIADAPQEQLYRYEPPQGPPATDNRYDRFYYQPSSPQDMTFQDYGVNPFVQTQADPLSTFSMDVDTGSFTVARNYLNRNTAPPPAAIRVEEILNYFPAPYPAPKEADFAVYGEMAPSPFGANLHLLKIGIKGREMRGERKPVVLTFVIDVSGSMSQENRLGLVQRTLTYLVGFMRPEDQIGIAVYGTNGREVLTHTPVSSRATILNAINGLHSEGSTNAAEGLLIGYGMARRAFNANAINRVVLCSDGVANTGVTDAPGILDLIGQAANDRIYLTSLGVGMGNYNDTLMEQLADKGNGHYAYLDGDQEAQRYVSRELVGAMEVIAQDTKIQVEFNAEVVKQYRLIGFENRNVADSDFRNDKVDAGEIGTGHAVTALYEVELAQGAETELAATVRVRYKQPDKEMKAKEIAGKLKLREIMKTFEASEPHMKLVAIAAEYAEILRNSYWSQGSDMRQVAALFDRTFPGNPPGPEAGELRGLIEIASRVAWNRPAPVPPIGIIPNEPTPAPFPGTPGNEIPMEEAESETP